MRASYGSSSSGHGGSEQRERAQLDDFGTYHRDSSDDSWDMSTESAERERERASGSCASRSSRVALLFLACVAAVSLTLALTGMGGSSAATESGGFLASLLAATTQANKESTDLPVDISVGQDTTIDVAVGQEVTVEEESEMTFTIMRDGYDPLIYFTPLDISIMKYSILDPYVGVIEPHSPMTIEIFGTADDKYYSFDVCNTADTTDCQTGYLYTTGNTASTTVTFDCTPREDEYSVVVSERSSQNDAVLRSSTGYALCMYVRREIRTLTEADRDATMDAMYTMWSTNEAIGQNKYGKNFHSSTYLLEFHFFNAAWQDGDHIHEGNGFLHQHIKMSNIFEDSIQSVDPTVTLPYWDFTIESAQNISVMLSPIMTPEMFGSMPRAYDQYWGWTFRNDSMEAAAIQDSRWAFIKADKNDRYDDLDFAYGYLRAPWNMNPSPYLSRFTSTNKHLPSCVSHYNMLQYDDLADFLFAAPYAAHAATHGTIGGVYGCDMMDPMMDMGYILSDDGQINLCKNWIFYIKEFYRLNYLVPNQNCTLTMDENGKEQLDSDSLTCGYTCNPDETENFVFELKNILNSDNDCVPYDLQDKGWMAWKDFICTGDGYKIFGGDHLEAASPADPSFWPIHPTLERLLQAKFMGGGFADDSWPTDPTTDYVCDKASCYDEAYGFGYWDTCCYGHFEDDQLMDAATGDRDNGYGYTNKEIHTYTDPTSYDYGMSYIYADFDWSHCELVGLDFVGLLEEMAEERSASEEVWTGLSGSALETADAEEETEDATTTEASEDEEDEEEDSSDKSSKKSKKSKSKSKDDDKSSKKSSKKSKKSSKSSKSSSDRRATLATGPSSRSSKKAAAAGSATSRSTSASSKSEGASKRRVRRTLADDFETLTDKEKASRLRRLKYVKGKVGSVPAAPVAAVPAAAAAAATD